MFALFPKFGDRTRTQDLWLFLISETELKFLIWAQGKIHRGNRASPVNRAHMKRPQSNRDLGKWAVNFAMWTLHPGYRGERRDEF